MATLNMDGPYTLNTPTINAQVSKKNSPGNYALGHSKKSKDSPDKSIFIVEYVGRSDTDLNGRLHQHVGSKYKEFKFSYASSPKEAFEKECKNYHDFGESEKLNNDIHPDRPDNSDWKCPYCNNFD